MRKTTSVVTPIGPRDIQFACLQSQQNDSGIHQHFLRHWDTKQNYESNAFFGVILFFFVHPPVQRPVPCRERNHGKATVPNGLTCQSV